MQTTRRRFASALPALPVSLKMMAQPRSSRHAPRWIFLGTDKGKGIYRASWNEATGALGTPELALEAVRPTFFAWHPNLPVLYSANEGVGTQASVSAYAVDAAMGSLTLLNTLQTHGDSPCFVSVDRSGHAAYAANYTGGSITAYRVGSRGELAEIVGVLAYKQPQHGPVTDRQDAAHLHCATISPGNDFVLVCDLGDDVILAFPIAPMTGASIQAPVRFSARTGSGPRHVAFHPNGRWMYCMHELDCSVDLYDWGVTDRTPSLVLRPGSVVPTLAPGENTAGSTGCEVIVSDDGRFLTTCTRGVNTIVVYRIDATSGLLTEQQRLSCGGEVPRQIAFDPSRRWLLSMNQGSSTVTLFAHDRATGRLTPKRGSVAAETPMCAAWV